MLSPQAKTVESEPMLVDIEISAIDATAPVHKSTFKWKEPLRVWYKIRNPLDTEIDVLLQCQIRDPVTGDIHVPDKTVRVQPGTEWYSLTTSAPSHAGKANVIWEIYAPAWEKKYGEIGKEKYLTIEKGELPEEPTVKKSTTLRVIPSNFTVKTGESTYISAQLTADGEGELEYKTINWSAEKGTLSSKSTVSGESNTYQAPNYETVDTVMVSFAGSEGYRGSKYVVFINVKASFKIIDFETEWWETVSAEEPQFVITVFNKGDHEFTITKVVLSGIEVWNGRFTVNSGSRADLKISDISEVTERNLVNNLNEVYIENAFQQPAYHHNIVITGDLPTTSSYSEGHTQVFSWTRIIRPPELFIEVDYMPGHKPTQSVLDYITDYYAREGISVTFYVDDEVSLDSEMTIDEFFNYEATFNDLGDDKITSFWFFWKDYKLTSKWKWVLFGEVDVTNNANGYTYTGGRNDAGNYIFVADKSNDELASTWEEYGVTAEEVETVVLMHELGHTIGILKTDTEGNQVYDPNRWSVMSYLSIVNCNSAPIRYSSEYWELRDIEYYTAD
jgi:hypothetical protein